MVDVRVSLEAEQLVGGLLGSKTGFTGMEGSLMINFLGDEGGWIRRLVVLVGCV